MKKEKVIYWSATGLFSVFMLFGALQYFTSEEAIANFVRLGFHDYFRVELGVMKLIGVSLLLIPVVPNRVKEWAYAGFGITLISASIAHSVHGDPAINVIFPLIFLGILAVSNIYLYRYQAYARL